MSEYIRVNINFLPENRTHMSVYNEIMEAKKNKIHQTEFLINTVLELRKYKAEKQQLEERQKRYAEYMEYRNAQTGGAIEQLLDPIPYNIPAPKVETGRELPEQKVQEEQKATVNYAEEEDTLEAEETEDANSALGNELMKSMFF